MISRRTIFSLLLALLLAAGIRLWSLEHQSDCDRFVRGEKTLPPSQMVDSGTLTMEIPCRQWLPRQPVTLQILCLVDLGIVVVFVMNAMADIRDSIQTRKQRAGMRL
jgi:hypothetical protein